MLQIIQKCVKDAEILRYIDICKNSGQLLLSLVNSILDLNQIRAKKLKLYPEKLDVHSFLKEICALFEFQCTHKDLLLNVKVSPKVPRYFVTDKNRLSQILINLMGNALKFTSKGSISILVNPTTHADYVELSIVDTGIGIKDQEKVKLFKMFLKLEDSDSTLNRQGVGLGLTISDNLARLLCCNSEKEGIKVDSEDKKGSRFYFVIKRVYQDAGEESDSSLEKSYVDSSVPSAGELDEVEDKMKKYSTLTPKFPSTGVIFKRDSSSFIKASEKSLSPIRANSSKKISKRIDSKDAYSILIVDDNPLNIAVAKHLVSCHGYRVKTALYGQVAIDMILDNHKSLDPIKLILMDCQMPLMDGYEVTRILKELMRQNKIETLPIIALTANDSEGDRETCLKARMSDHLSKPLKETELVKMLQKYLG